MNYDDDETREALEDYRTSLGDHHASLEEARAEHDGPRTIVLPDEILTEAVTLAPHEPLSAIVLVWKTLVPDWDQRPVGSIKPADYRLPHEQWTKIATALASRKDSGLIGANVVMDWVNIGPGCADENESVPR